MRYWMVRHWLVVAAGVVGAALAIGIPTGVVTTPFYTRMTPVLWWNYPVWAASAVLTGLILGTHVAVPKGGRTRQRKAVAGGLLSVFAVGCPICKKLVVLALGMSGALTYFAPLQPLLAVASVALLAIAFGQRLRTMRSCPVPVR